MRSVVVLGVIAGCGRFGFDEHAPTSGDDGPAERGTLSIRVTTHIVQQTLPVADAVVWTTTADGAIDDVQRTDLDGRATLQIEAGGTVSAHDAASMWVTTFTGAEPGDVLEAGLAFPLCAPQPVGVVTFNWVAPLPAPTSVEALAGCFRTRVPAPPLMLDIDPNVGEPFDVMLRAFDDDDELIASATKPGAAFADGVTHTFASTEWVPGVQRTFGFTGLAGLSGELSQLNSMFSTPGASVPNAAVTASGATVTDDSLIVTKSVPADVTRMTSIGFVGINNPSNAGLLVAEVDGPIGVVEATPVPPRPSTATWDGAGRLSWTIAGSGEVDAIDVLAGFFDASETLMLVWTVRNAPGTTSVVLPALPPGLVLPDLAQLTLDEHYLITNNYANATDYRTARQYGEGGDPLIALFSGLPSLTKYTGSYALAFQSASGTKVAPPAPLFGLVRDLRR